MPAMADDAGQVIVVVETARIGRRAGVAQQQRARVTLGFGLRDRLVEFDFTVLPEADVAMRVDEAGHNPAAIEYRLGASDRFGAQKAVDNPPLDRLAIG
jgi:hypothetical protein